eukprot:4754207-Amphidinium_carterae.1
MLSAKSTAAINQTLRIQASALAHSCVLPTMAAAIGGKTPNVSALCGNVSEAWRSGPSGAVVLQMALDRWQFQEPSPGFFYFAFGVNIHLLMNMNEFNAKGCKSLPWSLPKSQYRTTPVI